jgi:hypothetical protein
VPHGRPELVGQLVGETSRRHGKLENSPPRGPSSWPRQVGKLASTGAFRVATSFQLVESTPMHGKLGNSPPRGPSPWPRVSNLWNPLQCTASWETRRHGSLPRGHEFPTCGIHSNARQVGKLASTGAFPVATSFQLVESAPGPRQVRKLASTEAFLVATSFQLVESTPMHGKLGNSPPRRPSSWPRVSNLWNPLWEASRPLDESIYLRTLTLRRTPSCSPIPFAIN